MSNFNLAGDELREKWLTTIAASLPRLVLWRAARKFHNEIRRTIKEFELHLHRILADLNRLWRGPSVLVQCDRLRVTLESLEHGYAAAMSWLETSQTIDGIRISNWQNPDCRTQREFIIKQMVIFQQRCNQLEDLSTYFIEQTSSQINSASPSLFQQDVQLGNFVNRAEWTFNEALDNIRQRYNSGQLFADFVRVVLDDVAAEKDLYARRRKVYRYPNPTLIVVDEEDAEILHNFRPLSGVPKLQDDHHAHWLLF